MVMAMWKLNIVAVDRQLPFESKVIWKRKLHGEILQSDKMIVLTKYKFLLKLIGFNPLGGYENIFVQLIYFIVIISTSAMTWLYFFINIGQHIHMYQAWAALPVAFTGTPNVAIYLHFLNSRQRFYSLLDEVQDIINISMIPIKIIISDRRL